MHVGMNLQYVDLRLFLAGVPHARGDEPKYTFYEQHWIERSPCTWG